MKNFKIDPLFGSFIIIFIVTNVLLIKDFSIQKSNDLKYYSASIEGIVRGKDSVIKSLTSQLAVKQNENQDLRNTLAETRNELEALTKKLSQPVSHF